MGLGFFYLHTNVSCGPRIFILFPELFVWTQNFHITWIICVGPGFSFYYLNCLYRRKFSFSRGPRIFIFWIIYGRLEFCIILPELSVRAQDFHFLSGQTFFYHISSRVSRCLNNIEIDRQIDYMIDKKEKRGKVRCIRWRQR